MVRRISVGPATAGRTRFCALRLTTPIASSSVGSAIASQSSSPFSRSAMCRTKRSAQVRASSKASAAGSGGVIARSIRGSPSSTEMARATVPSVAYPISATCCRMWPPVEDRARLSTASCWRSSRIWILTSRSMIDGTGPPIRLYSRGGRRRVPRVGLYPQNREVFGGAGRLPLPGAVLADGSGAGVGRSELDEVLAREAGVAEAARLRVGRLVHAIPREIAKRVRGDVLRDLLLAVRGGDQLAAHRRVDAVVAGPARRRRADAEMDFAGAGIADHLYDLAAGGAAHDGVVDHHHPLAAHYRRHGIELQLHPEMADGLRRLDERAPHVVAADQSQIVGDPALLGIPERRGHPGVGHRDDDVRLHRRLDREPLPQCLA